MENEEIKLKAKEFDEEKYNEWISWNADDLRQNFVDDYFNDEFNEYCKGIYMQEGDE